MAKKRKEKVFTLIETIYHENQDSKIIEKGFDTKNHLVKALKKYAPVTNKIIYELTKHGEVEFEYGGLKRKFEIIEE